MKLLDQVGLILKQKGSQVYTITPHVTVYEALEKMADNGIGALVVMERAIATQRSPWRWNMSVLALLDRRLASVNQRAQI